MLAQQLQVGERDPESLAENRLPGIAALRNMMRNVDDNDAGQPSHSDNVSDDGRRSTAAKQFSRNEFPNQNESIGVSSVCPRIPACPRIPKVPTFTKNVKVRPAARENHHCNSGMGKALLTLENRTREPSVKPQDEQGYFLKVELPHGAIEKTVPSLYAPPLAVRP